MDYTASRGQSIECPCLAAYLRGPDRMVACRNDFSCSVLPETSSAAVGHAADSGVQCERGRTIDERRSGVARRGPPSGCTGAADRVEASRRTDHVHAEVARRTRRFPVPVFRSSKFAVRSSGAKRRVKVGPRGIGLMQTAISRWFPAARAGSPTPEPAGDFEPPGN